MGVCTCATDVVQPKVALQVRMRKAHKELSKGNKVKVVVQFKGREMSSLIPTAKDLVQQLADHVEDVSTLESAPRIQGRQLVATLNPTSRQP